MGLVTDLDEKRPDIPSTSTDSYCSGVSKGETIYLSPAAVPAASPEPGRGPKEHKDMLPLYSRVWTTLRRALECSPRRRWQVRTHSKNSL